MTDGQPNIIGPIGGLLGLGVMAYAAKGVIDVLKNKAEEQKKKPSRARILPNQPQDRKPGEGFDFDSKIQRMLGK